MSFKFEWPRFSDQFHTDAIQMLNNALNKGNKPPVIADKIEVVELEMGTQPPELEIRDIGDLTMDQFRGIFRLTYDGDAHIVLKTKVQVSILLEVYVLVLRDPQANPLNHKQPDIHLITGSRGMLAAKQPLVVPMLLQLSHFKLNSYVVLVVSKQKGITLVFKTDPLQNVDINSSFDSIAVIQKFIQKEIEGQLRQMFKEDLPGIIHRLSQQWVKAKVEAPYLTRRPHYLPPAPAPTRRPSYDTMSAPDVALYQVANVGLYPHMIRQQSPGPISYDPAPSNSGPSVTSRSPSQKRTLPASRPQSPLAIPTVESTSSFPDLENFDPTYGLRPEGLPVKSVFSSFGKLFAPNKGLADLAEGSDEGSEREDLSHDYDYDEVGSGSFDVVGWEDTVPDFSPSPSVGSNESPPYERIPAVGGGVITRPRIYHSQSMAHLQTEGLMTSTPRPRPQRLSQPYDQGTGPTHAALQTNPPGQVRSPQLTRPKSTFDVTGRPLSSGSELSRSSSGITPPIATPPAADNSQLGERDTRPRSEHGGRMSVSSSNFDGFLHDSQSNTHDISDPDPKIVLRPLLNNSLSQLSTLYHSNHTLSPYTRSLAHFAVRSGPPTQVAGLSAAGERPKARRKRTHRLGGKKAEEFITPPADIPRSPPSPVPPSEFDVSDMDRYFRARDDFIPQIPDLHPYNVRR